MLSLLFKGAQLKDINGIELDAVLSESIDNTNTITQHPIEGGGTVVDHIYENPLLVMMEGVITNASLYSDDTGRAVRGYEALKQLKASRVPFTLVNALDVFPNMVFTSIISERDGSTADAYRFIATLQQITIVDSVTVDLGERAAPASRNQASRQNNAGRQPLQPASPAQTQDAQAVILGPLRQTLRNIPGVQ